MPEHSRTRNVDLAVAIARDGRPSYVIAAAAGINQPDFSGIVSGRITPTPARRAAIAAALGVEEADLFGQVPA
jgi:hypothetical protein